MRGADQKRQYWHIEIEATVDTSAGRCGVRPVRCSTVSRISPARSIANDPSAAIVVVKRRSPLPAERRSDAFDQIDRLREIGPCFAPAWPLKKRAYIESGTSAQKEICLWRMGSRSSFL